MTKKPNAEKTVAPAPKDAKAQEVGRPEDVPDNELEAVAAGRGHERWYHHHEGRRGYYRNGAFIQIDL